jgi:hypothetical protein
MQERIEPVNPATRETEAEAGSDAPLALEASGEPALCFSHLSEAARRARASHPAYASRFPARYCEPPQPA